jgi:hypothetical protein
VCELTNTHTHTCMYSCIHIFKLYRDTCETRQFSDTKGVSSSTVSLAQSSVTLNEQDICVRFIPHTHTHTRIPLQSVSTLTMGMEQECVPSSALTNDIHILQVVTIDDDSVANECASTVMPMITTCANETNRILEIRRARDVGEVCVCVCVCVWYETYANILFV